jgi:hypothetical protein
VAQLSAHQEKIEGKGARIAAIGLGDMRYARAFREDTAITFPLLSDDARKAYQAAQLKKANLLHLFWSANAEARKKAKLAGFRQLKLGKDPFQLGATFIFAPGDVDRFIHISDTFGDNAPVENVISAL